MKQKQNDHTSKQPISQAQISTTDVTQTISNHILFKQKHNKTKTILEEHNLNEAALSSFESPIATSKNQPNRSASSWSNNTNSRFPQA